MSKILYSPKYYKILCEGESEEVYIKHINKILRDRNIDTLLGTHTFKNGDFNNVMKIVKKYNHKDKQKLRIWIDEDIYKRNEQQNYTKYLEYKNKMPDFLFTQYNFEDFLIMHLDDKIIIEWQEKLIKRNNFNVPLISDEYIDLLKKNINIFRDYKKGVLPFDITLDNIKQAYKTHQATNIKFKSDFLDFINEYIISLE